MDMPSKNGSEQTGAAPRLAKIKIIDSSHPPLEKNMTASHQKEPLMKRLMRWLVPDQRVANRHTMPPLIAYLGLVRSSKEYKIGDISIAGFYMLTEERWIAGTGFPVTLERTDEGANGQTLTVFCTVVRASTDGVGFSFLHSADEDNRDGEAQGTTRVDLTKLAQFLNGLPLSDPNAEALERAS